MEKIVKAAFIAVFVAITGYGIYANQKAEPMSDLVLANVEALANDEGSGDFDCRWDSYLCICCDAYGIYLGCPCGSHNW